eukprot:SAG31_NODE_5617_length_2422_cov_1.289281_1_plen_297_part_10
MEPQQWFLPPGSPAGQTMSATTPPPPPSPAYGYAYAPVPQPSTPPSRRDDTALRARSLLQSLSSQTPQFVPTLPHQHNGAPHLPGVQPTDAGSFQQPAPLPTQQHQQRQWQQVAVPPPQDTAVAGPETELEPPPAASGQPQQPYANFAVVVDRVRRQINGKSAFNLKTQRMEMRDGALLFMDYAGNSGHQVCALVMRATKIQGISLSLLAAWQTTPNSTILLTKIKDVLWKTVLVTTTSETFKLCVTDKYIGSGALALELRRRTNKMFRDLKHYIDWRARTTADDQHLKWVYETSDS